MPRPRIIRCLRFRPKTYYYKPQGIPMRHLTEMVLAPDEVEAIKLYEVDGLDQKSAAIKMKVSQPTFARTLDRGLKKISTAIIKGLAIKIEKND